MDCSAATAAIAGAKSVVICIVSSGPPWWSYVPAFITPIIGLFALYFAWQNILNARDLARNKATLDLIEKKESTEYYRVINDAFSRLRMTVGFRHLNDPQTEGDRKDRQAIVDYLNHYEMIAIGIEKKILDASLYRSWMLGPFVRDWNAAAGWIQRERWRAGIDGNWTYRAAIFENFQHIACRWSADAVKLDSTMDKPTGEPTGVSDEVLPEPRRFGLIADD